MTNHDIIKDTINYVSSRCGIPKNRLSVGFKTGRAHVMMVGDTKNDVLNYGKTWCALGNQDKESTIGNLCDQGLK